MYISYTAIARVEKTHGRSGEVVAHPVGGLSPLLERGMHVAVVPPVAKRSRYHEIEDVQALSSTRQLITLSGVDDMSAAEALVGKTIMIKTEDVPKDARVRYSLPSLIGREVLDADGRKLGTIVDILSSPAQDVWEIELAGTRWMMPAVDEFIVGEREDGAYIVQPPLGLLPDDVR